MPSNRFSCRQVTMRKTMVGIVVRASCARRRRRAVSNVAITVADGAYTLAVRRAA